MEPGLSTRRRGEEWLRGEGGHIAARPLVRPAPRSAMFFPLVVLVAVLPGLAALRHWDLTPPGPWWGLRALAVLDGWLIDQAPAARELKPPLESWTFRQLAFQPPLYAWLEAAGLALSTDRDPLASVLPSYIAGALVVVLVYLHGRYWRGAGTGLIAALLTGFNVHLLVQMQQATPTTLGLAGAVAALLAYVGHRRATAESWRPWSWGGSAFWTAVGGLSLGLSFLAVGGFAFLTVVVVLLHQAYLLAGLPPAERLGPWWRGWRDSPSIRAGCIALAIAVALAGPWHLRMYLAHGSEFFWAVLSPFPGGWPDRPNLLAWLIALAPATMVLGLYSALRAARLALTDENDAPEIVGGVFWILWLAVAAVAPALWPSGPRYVLALFLLVPLNLLAAQAISDLATRRIPIRTLWWLAPATAVTLVWWSSEQLQNAVDDLVHARANPATALGVHLAFDVLIIAVLTTRRLDRWARRRDDRQRWILGGYLFTVLAVTVVIGIREVRFRHSETRDLLDLRSMILRRNRERPFDVVAVVGPELAVAPDGGALPGGRLRFILRSALPDLPQRDLTSSDDLLQLPKEQLLVVLAGMEQLSITLQSRLNLEAIHPGRKGTLEAFATVNEPTRAARR
jgi:4-amino-4-deoxy-L-arabinose transferase-like glycosyltransferase